MTYFTSILLKTIHVILLIEENEKEKKISYWLMKHSLVYWLSIWLNCLFFLLHTMTIWIARFSTNSSLEKAEPFRLDRSKISTNIIFYTHEVSSQDQFVFYFLPIIGGWVTKSRQIQAKRGSNMFSYSIKKTYLFTASELLYKGKHFSLFASVIINIFA
jgi:hypothetical protein